MPAAGSLDGRADRAAAELGMFVAAGESRLRTSTGGAGVSEKGWASIAERPQAIAEIDDNAADSFSKVPATQPARDVEL